MNENDIDRRLQEASSEVRQVARQKRIPTPPAPSAAPRGWLVFATAFVGVVVIGLVPLLGNRGTVEPGDGTVPTTRLATPTTTTTVPSTSTISLIDTCSASGIELPLPAEGLPPAVADTRDAIIEAASSCSLAQLVDIAGDDLMTSFGDDVGVERLLEWESGDDGQLGTLLKVLSMSHAVVEPEGEPQIYVWPAAFAYDFWEDIPADQLEELSSLYTTEELEQLSVFGSYAGWRAGIDETGDWLFFIAGD